LAIASAVCASPAWSADRVAISNVPAAYALPPCHDPGVLAQIAAEYRGRHRVPDLAAVGILDVRPTTHKYWPADMPRQFCEAIISSPRPERLSIHPSYYPIYYAIIGPGYELEWCVVGLDRAWPVDPRCRLARP
jgi:hypothetical protein